MIGPSPLPPYVMVRSQAAPPSTAALRREGSLRCATPVSTPLYVVRGRPFRGSTGRLHPEDSMMRRALLACGLVSSLLYVGIDIFGALSWPGYSYTGQAISEMTAVDAPTRALLLPVYFVYGLLFFPFALGIWRSAGPSRALRIIATCLFLVALLDFAWPFFPMHMRGAGTTSSDTGHLLLGGADMLLLMIAIASSALAFGKGFRVYAIATMLVILLFGTLMSLDVPRVAAGLPTPWLGLNERLMMAAWLLWIAVLSIRLAGPGESAPAPRSAASRR